MATLIISYVGGGNTPGGFPTFLAIPCSVTFTVQGGTGPYTWTISAGALPAGVTATTFSGGASSTYVLSGVPAALGAYSYTVQAADSASNTGTVSFAASIIANGITLTGLVLTAEPGFSEIPAANLAYGLPLTSAVLKAINSTVKFAAVRTEYFYGYYTDGMTVGLPVSLTDGYQYAREELRYLWSIVWTGSANWGAGEKSVSGSTAAANLLTGPGTGPTSAPGQLLQCGYFVDPASGRVSCTAAYYSDGGAQGNTNDGILLVHTIAKRLR